MSISFKCKKCGKGYKVGDDKAGKKIKCRQCAAPVQIPKAEVDDFSEDWEEEAEYTPPTRRRARSKPKKQSKKKSASGSNQSVLIAFCIVGVLVVGGIGFFLFSSDKPGGGLAKAMTDKADAMVNGDAPKVKKSAVENMKQIGLAFHNFHDSFTRFPPADAHLVDGKPLLSWRVHMLPFLGQAELYKQFNLKEPWDSPQNKALLSKMPAIYTCDGISKPGYTSIMTFSGKDTPFTGGQGPQLRKFTDGSSNTILFVQAGPNKAVPWTQPIDLPLNAANPISVLGQSANGEFLCTLADGAVKKISSGTPAQILKNAIQPNDGNPAPL
ncbi:DUF1559 domain-containing protein [Gimesia aquarii]|uniref:DUF1559 domain-containing protein n=1 Tax=Gimesia aquarii TaxID=2527964 RepID=A0A517WN22_9PLAN|nr:DUF1559 domain-containing protein [Gimesia aquarii]QDU06666.1 hypothetical protein V202x_00090 [Gimesia aquarii]